MQRRSRSAGAGLQRVSRRQAPDKIGGDHHKKKHHRHRDSQQDRKQQNGSTVSGSKFLPATASSAVQTDPTSSSIPPQPQTALPSDQASGYDAVAIPTASPLSTAQTARETTAHSAKISIGALLGAILAGVVLLLLLLGLVAYWCSHRKKKETRSKSVRFAKSVEERGVNDMMTFITRNRSDEASDESCQTAYQGHRCAQPHGVGQTRGSARGHEAVVLSQSATTMLSTKKHWREESLTARPLVIGRDLAHFDADSSQALGRDHDGANRGDQVESLPNEVSQTDCVTDHGGNDTEIERCLSYYLKHNSRAVDTEDPPSASDHLSAFASPTRLGVQEKGARRSLGFPKTKNLLQKIRRSQIRLDNEAMSNAHDCGDRSWRRVSEQLTPNREQSDCTSPSFEYDLSTPPASDEKQAQESVPAYRRSSANRSSFRGDEQDPMGSSPHSAFQYTDYYDGYEVDPRRSVRLQIEADEAEAAWTTTWQDDPPCRSSALSPRGSGQEGVRQRGATPSLSSPSRWVPSTGTGVYAREDTPVDPWLKERLAASPAKRLASAEADHVIHF